MKKLADFAVLTVFCLGALFFVPSDAAAVSALLSTLILTALSAILESRKAALAIAAAWIALCFVNPDTALFAPLLVLQLFSRRNAAACAAVLMFALIRSPLPITAGLFFIVTGGTFAVLLKLRSASLEDLRDRMISLRDESVVTERLLEQRNRSILKRQDSEILTATLLERNRIAREIHDNVGHMVSRSILMVGAMRAVNRQAPLEEMLSGLEQTLGSAMTSLRESVHDLRDQALNLEAGIRGLMDDFTFCETELSYECTHNPPREVKYSFLSIVKEALSNVMRHSDAKKVTVTMREHPGFYQLVISDDGSARAQPDETGMGLSNMRDRIRALGGSIRFLSTQGFRIHITVPRKEEP